MTTELIKMVGQYQSCHDPALYRILFAMAEQIEANEAEIEQLRAEIASWYTKNARSK